jgi:hypothetical protein
MFLLLLHHNHHHLLLLTWPSGLFQFRINLELRIL